MKIFTWFIFFSFLCIHAHGQVAINADESSPDPSAILDVKSTEKGLLPPRMTTAERNNINSPADGLIIVNTTKNCLEIYFNPSWECLAVASGPEPEPEPWVCGDILTVSHSSGPIAPEDKTVNYGTVQTDLSGIDRCWITQNLGAESQASSASDASSAARGWFWRFNRIQGYADASTPAWPGGSISESSDWVLSVDPCRELLGGDWRIPTQTEWTSAQSGWSNSAAAYSSVLKLHQAGYMHLTAGTLTDSGVTGYYWSSTQASTTAASSKALNASTSAMFNFNKSMGVTLRCIQ